MHQIFPGRKVWFSPIIVYVTLVFIEFRGIASECDQLTVGSFGDAFGTMWGNWVQTSQPFPPWQKTTDFVSFPTGEPFWTFDWWTSVFIRIPLYLFSQIFGPICGYNAMVGLGFLFTSLSMFVLAFWLTKKTYVSILAGAMFGFGPYLQSKMTGHINYMYVGVYPLLIYILLRVSNRSNLGLIFSGLVIGSFTYIDGYFFVPAIGSVLILLFIQCVTALKNSFQFKSLKNVKLPFFLSYFFMQLPIVILFFSRLTSGGSVATQRDWNELNVYSIKAWHFVMPPPTNPYFGPFFKDFQTQNLAGSNFSETSLYPGLAFILFAAYAVFVNLIKPVFGRRGNPKAEITKNQKVTLQIKWLILFFLLGIWLAMRPLIYILGMEVPFPSGVLYHLLPYWRTISRWGIITTVAIIALGSIGVTQLIRRKPKFLSVVILFFFTITTLLDLGFPKTLNPKIVSATQLTGPYDWLNRNTSENAVLLDVVPYSVDGFFLGMALTSKRKMANALRFPNESKRLELLYPGRPDFLCNVNSVEADYVIIHPSFYESTNYPLLPGFKKVKRFYSQPNDEYFDWNNSTIYAPSASDRPDLLETYDSGFTLVSDGQWGADWFLMASQGFIKIKNLNPSGSKQAYLDLRVKLNPEKVRVFLDGRTVYSGTITLDKPIQVNIPDKGAFELSVVRLKDSSEFGANQPNLSVEIKNAC
jgi:hypothetical protein